VDGAERDFLCSPSEILLDRQSVKSAAFVHEAVGDDAAKLIKGRKRHLTVDCLGLMMRVFVTAASLPEREGDQQVLQQVKDRHPAELSGCIGSGPIAVIPVIPF
jgi:hypothetical protein